MERTLLPGALVALACGAQPAEGRRPGRGSCGTTQLALLAAQSLWHAGEVDLVIWADASSRASALSGLADAARAMIGAELPGTAESVAAQLINWLRATRRPWLVVLDDLHSPEVMDGLWPEGPTGAVLVTTRSSAASFGGRQARVLPVPAFSTREALNYLVGSLTRDTDQRLGAISLVEELGGEPLALAQAVAVIAGSALTCLSYRDHLASRRARLSAANGHDLPPWSVTWTLSLEQADQLSADGAARLLLVLAALLGSHGIPGTVFSTSAVFGYLAGAPAAGQDWGQADRQHAWEALLILERTGLLALNPPGEADATVWMSRAVQHAIQAALPRETRDQGGQAAADALLQAWPREEPRAGLAGELRSCAASLIKATGDLLWVGRAHPLLLRVGQSLADAGLTGPATQYWRDFTAAAERVLGQDHPDTIMADEKLADAYIAAGQAEDALPWIQWVLDFRIRTLGQVDVGTIATRRKLGHALVAAGRFANAAAILEQAAGDYERASGPGHPDTIGTREDVAAAYVAAGQFDEAGSLYRRTLADRERNQGPLDPATLATRRKLAEVLAAAGQLRQARNAYKRVVADSQRVLGQNHPDTLAALRGLGSVSYRQGRIVSSLRLYEQVASGYEDVLGLDHRDTLAAREELAAVYAAAGRPTDAARLLSDVVARCKRVLPEGDPLTRTARDSLRNITGQ